MTFDEQGRQFVRVGSVVRIVWWIEQSMRRLPAGGWEFDGFNPGQVVGDPQISPVKQVSCLFEDLELARSQVQRDNGRRPIRGAATKHYAIAFGAYRSKFREPCRDRLDGSGYQIQGRELPEPCRRIGTYDASGVRERVSRHAEIPLRHAEFRHHWEKWPRRFRNDIVSVQIPPAATVGNEDDLVAIGRPFWLKYGFGHATRDDSYALRRAARIDVREIQRGAVPRHVGMVPGKPYHPIRVWRQARRTEEIVSACQDAARRCRQPVEIHRYDGIDGCAFAAGRARRRYSASGARDSNTPASQVPARTGPRVADTGAGRQSWKRCRFRPPRATMHRHIHVRACAH